MTLQRRLTLWVAAAVAVSLLASATILWAAFGQALWGQFDARLRAEARGLADLVEDRTVGPVALEPNAASEFAQNHPGTAFELRSGETVLASGGTRSDQPRSLTVELPARWDDEAPRTREPRLVTVTVSRDGGEVVQTLSRARLLLAAASLASLLLAALAAALAIRRGLAPVRRLAGAIDAIDAAQLGQRLSLTGLPDELVPAVARLNQLLERLEASFDRERRFSADVSHELRTPLAGLRSVLEVAASRPRSAEAYRASIGEALEIVMQTSGLAEQLLLLARLDARQVAVRVEPVALHALVESCFSSLAARASERSLRFENKVAPTFSLAGDPEKLRAILTNLLGNAVEYTEGGGWIEVASDPSSGLLLDVADSGPPIPPSEREKIFDRFHRLDDARTGTGAHAGIGLSLVRALCEQLDLSVDVNCGNDGSVHFQVRFVAASARIA